MLRNPKNQNLESGGLRAAKAVCRDRGISDVTLWRYRSKGWIKTVNICGRPYVDLLSLADFDRRAAAGEFAKPVAGAAKIASDARTERIRASQSSEVEVAA